jgi:hypothetical protein
MPIIYRTRRNHVGEVIHGTPPDKTANVPNGNQGFRQVAVPAITKEGASRLNSRSVAQSPVGQRFMNAASTFGMKPTTRTVACLIRGIRKCCMTLRRSLK